VNKGYDRMRDPAAFKVVADSATGGTFGGLRASKYTLLITFRKNGDAVPSPVWAAVDAEGRLYLETEKDSGKVKRIRNNPQVIVAPATVRGKPKGTPIAGSARIVATDEWAHAEETLSHFYGLGRRLYTVLFSMPEASRAYVEVSPSRTSGA
jgi:hypothetical protein